MKLSFICRSLISVRKVFLLKLSLRVDNKLSNEVNQTASLTQRRLKGSGTRFISTISFYWGSDCYRNKSKEDFTCSKTSFLSFRWSRSHFSLLVLMRNRAAFWIALFVSACIGIRVVNAADECKTQNDCKQLTHSCCPTTSGEKRCERGWCNYCTTDADCTHPSTCCRSNKCVSRGCSGCTNNTDCDILHYCCKKTSLSNQAFCASNCINESCNSNDDCGGRGECCRSGKCVDFGCKDKCTSDSECDSGEYCCKRATRGDGCSRSCVGESCSSDDDCGGPNECCISNKCVITGCSGCNTSSDCSKWHYCCKKTFPFDQRFCSAKCINESCNWNNDCSGRGECCRAGKCANTGCYDRCKSNSECDIFEYCCKKGGSHEWYRLKKNSGCRRRSCIGERCRSDDDCGGPFECCISDKCVTAGCPGCNTSSDCDWGQYCCKRTFPYNETFCDRDCLYKSCNSNDDCGGPSEFCCLGKCKLKDCVDRCKSNHSVCDIGKYCCRCRESCVGHFCSSDGHCGGPNECCISNKCVTAGCSGCNNHSDCSSWHYCCKTSERNKAGECRADCIGEWCDTTNDCGGPDEICGSRNICEKETSSGVYLGTHFWIYIGIPSGIAFLTLAYCVWIVCRAVCKHV